MFSWFVNAFLFGLVQGAQVQYDGRSFIIDGKRQMLFGGCVHYPRAHYTEWPQIFQQAKDNGINLIETYVFWDIHEQKQGEFFFPDYPSSANVVDFVRLAGEMGLYVHLRFGPYVCAEWNYGGLPVWVRELNDGNIVFRTTDEVWMSVMESFVDKALEVVRDAKLLTEDGGPIIMVQIENEYGNIEYAYGSEGANYVSKVAEYALSKDLSIPWVMCQQGEGVGSAPPKEVINSCNGHYCDNWISKVPPSYIYSLVVISHAIPSSTPMISRLSHTCGQRIGLVGFRSGANPRHIAPRLMYPLLWQGGLRGVGHSCPTIWPLEDPITVDQLVVPRL
jgi:hypothetical protein